MSKHFSNNHRPNMTTALQKAGIDPNGYLSLRINQSMLPSNAELTIQVRDKATGELFTLNLNDEDNRLFGKNSRFYGQIMADGHVFNPYIHRRFIAVQFRDLVKRHGMNNVADAVAREYNWNYAIEQIQKECHKLALLERRDKEAFDERSCFFTLETLVCILNDYVAEVHSVIQKALSHCGSREKTVFIRHYGQVQRDHIRPMLYRFDCLARNAVACVSYADLEKLLEEFDFLELDQDIRLPDSFVVPFINAGAYYTLKHAIMFEGKTLYRGDQQQSLRSLLNTAKRSPNGCVNLYACHG